MVHECEEEIHEVKRKYYRKEEKLKKMTFEEDEHQSRINQRQNLYSLQEKLQAERDQEEA